MYADQLTSLHDFVYSEWWVLDEQNELKHKKNNCFIRKISEREYSSHSNIFVDFTTRKFYVTFNMPLFYFETANNYLKTCRPTDLIFAEKWMPNRVAAFCHYCLFSLTSLVFFILFCFFCYIYHIETFLKSCVCFFNLVSHLDFRNYPYTILNYPKSIPN